MMKGKLIRARYRSFGPQLQQDVLSVSFKFDGETYVHPIPNPGWSYHNLSLAFMAYMGIRPSDFDGGVVELDNFIPIQENSQGGYLIKNEVLLQHGIDCLRDCEWFDPDGEVWSNQGNPIPGMNINHDGGSKAGVPMKQ